MQEETFVLHHFSFLQSYVSAKQPTRFIVSRVDMNFKYFMNKRHINPSY